MEGKVPQIGDVVIYNVSENQKNAMGEMGNNSQSQLPAVIVAVWGNECVNLKVLVDGMHPDLWKTSVMKGDKPNNWQFKSE